MLSTYRSDSTSTLTWATSLYCTYLNWRLKHVSFSGLHLFCFYNIVYEWIALCCIFLKNCTKYSPLKNSISIHGVCPSYLYSRSSVPGSATDVHVHVHVPADILEYMYVIYVSSNIHEHWPETGLASIREFLFVINLFARHVVYIMNHTKMLG